MSEGLLVELHRLGIKLRLVDDRLDVLAPPGSLTPELRERLRGERDQLIALLRRAPAGGDLVEIIPRPQQRHEPFALTDIQHAYWVGRNPAVELGGVSAHYYFELDSYVEPDQAGLDLARLTESLNTMIGYHDMLRAIIRPDGQQVVLPTVPAYQIPVLDLRDHNQREREAELAGVRARMSGRAPAPQRWPLFDIRASRVSDAHLRLHLSLNLLIIDYFSLSLLFRDWRRAYTDATWRPEPLPLSFRDYVLALQALRAGARSRRAEEYWLGRLNDLPPAPELPLARQPSALTEVAFVHRHARLPRDRWESLKRAARRRGVTPSVVLMTAFSDVLRLWADRQTDFTLNLTLFDRPSTHPLLGEVIGDFTSLTMLAVPAQPGKPFTARAEALSGQLMRDLEHLSYSGVQVLRERARSQGTGLSALMPVVFTSAIGGAAVRGTDEDRRFFGELGYSTSQTPQVFLDHQVTEEQGELVFNWDSVDALFPAGLLDDLFATYRDLLERLADEEAVWDELRPIVAPPAWQIQERQRANATTRDYPARTLGELVEEQVGQRPDVVAVVAGEQRLTYRQLAGRACALARRLVERGASRGTLVGVVLDRGWEQVVAVLGVTWAGAAYLPVDPQWPHARRRQVLALGGARLVVCATELRDTLADLEVLTLDQGDVPDGGGGPVSDDTAPEDLAYVIFTSGSTGEPKGVAIDHRGVVNTILDINDRFGVGHGDRVLALSALSFDLSVYDIFGALAAGGAVVIPSPAAAHDPRRWTELIRAHGVTVWNSVPALMQMWVDALPAQPAQTDLRLVLLSGDWIPVALPDAVRARCPGAEVISLGGATEASIWSVCYPIGVVPARWSRIPYGKPLANQRLHVYDEHLQPCPVWTIGEICISGIGVAKGYWDDTDRTGERFVVHPVTNERLYRTGDLGRYLPGGDIELLGREDSQVKVNGYRIELGEITAALCRQPGVADALVRVDANPATGRRQLVAYVVLAGAAARPGSAPAGTPGTTLESLRQRLEALLPAYLVPHHYLLIDRIPVNANGKVTVAGLPSPWDEPAAGEAVAARDDLEQTLLQIWQDTLECDDFGVTDNFFELGADSLHAVRILTQLHDQLGVATEGDEALVGDEGLQVLFENPTITELATALRVRMGS